MKFTLYSLIVLFLGSSCNSEIEPIKEPNAINTVEITEIEKRILSNKDSIMSTEEITKLAQKIMSNKNISASDSFRFNEKNSTPNSVGQSKASAIGEWNVDMVYFINDGVKGDGSAPLVTTTWTFRENGTLSIKTNQEMKGLYSQDDTKLKIFILGSETIYKIVEFSEKSMVIQGTIVETESMSMLTLMEMSRLK